MPDIKLFRTMGGRVAELESRSMSLERSLQTLIEAHLDAFLGVRFLASEHDTGQKHRGRIDTLGLDENGYPVIIEYKRALNENVINQGLFYLDWLLDHRGDFELLVMRTLGREAAARLDWSGPRLVCIAGDFTRYDEHAVQQINRNIELIRYRRYGDDLLLLELINAVTAQPAAPTSAVTTASAVSPSAKTFTDLLAQAGEALTDRYEALRAYCLALGDDVQEKTLKHYVAFKRIKNFACAEVHPKTGEVLVYLKVDPDTIQERVEHDEALRNMSSIGHYGTGDLELRLRTDEDFERTRDLIDRSYELS
jgi:predicted transport protein